MSLISINDGVEFRIIDGNLLGSRHENVLVQKNESIKHQKWIKQMFFNCNGDAELV